MKVIVFGAGEFANNVLKKIEEKFEIVCFIDNQEQKHNTYFNEKYIILSPNEICNKCFEKVVLASINHASEMFTQLLQLGVREHDIIVDFVSRNQKVFKSDFLKMQLNELQEENRLDIAVKYLAIENYYEKNSYGFQLYKEMQMKRLKWDDKTAEKSLDSFKELIVSFEKNGLQEESYIICDERMRIMDGAHRVACALYFGIPFLAVKIVPKKFECNYTKEWFWEHKFKIDDIEKICNKYSTFFNVNEENMIAILWPPVQGYFEEITMELSKLVKIKEVVDKEFENPSQFQNIVRGIYAVDNIAEWKIQKKIEYMREYYPKVRIITFHLQNPRYRLKESTQLPLSIVGEKVKKIIRARYMEKIDSYYNDIIIHIADNYCQSSILKKIFSLDLNISFCFEKIKNYKYFLVKMDVPYMPVDFPYVFPIHKDVDILCNSEDIVLIKKQIKQFCLEYAGKYNLDIKVMEEDGVRYKICLQYFNYLIYMFDIWTKLSHIKQTFIIDAMLKRQYKNIYYEAEENFEEIIRIKEIIQYPNKNYHKRYLAGKILDKKWITRYLLYDESIINSVIESINYIDGF